MGVVTTKSAIITNRDAVPPVINDGRLTRGVLKSSIGSVAVGAADSATSLYILCSLPSSALVRGVSATCPAGMTTLAGDVGVYRNTADGGAAVSGQLFAAAQSCASALVGSNITNQSGNFGTDKQEQPLWQAAGMSADPQTTLDIVVKVTTANTGAAGRLGLHVSFCDNGS